jgi:hypothetical protein
MEQRVRSLLRRLAIAGTVLAGLSLVVVALAFCTASGRAYVARGLCAAIGGGMAGKLEIGRISALGLSSLRAHDVVFRAPDGKPAIEVAQTTVDFDIVALISGAYGFRRADIDGCLVHVTEDAQGKVNMDETFKSRQPAKAPKAPADGGSAIDLRNMITSDCVLVIGGGSLPPLRLVDLTGIMRVYVAPEGKVELRFDDYRGRIVKGLPTGQLDFEAVAGQVQTQQKQLLSFKGRGRSEGAPVAFTLHIATKPKKRVTIDANFPELSANAVRAAFVSAYTGFSPSITMNVSAGR